MNKSNICEKQRELSNRLHYEALDRELKKIELADKLEKERSSSKLVSNKRKRDALAEKAKTRTPIKNI